MNYKINHDIDALSLKEGDVFVGTGNGYKHEFDDNTWIGLPKEIVENSDSFEPINEELESLRYDVIEYIRHDFVTKHKITNKDIDELIDYVEEWEA